MVSRLAEPLAATPVQTRACFRCHGSHSLIAAMRTVASPGWRGNHRPCRPAPGLDESVATPVPGTLIRSSTAWNCGESPPLSRRDHQ